MNARAERPDNLRTTRQVSQVARLSYVVFLPRRATRAVRLSAASPFRWTNSTRSGLHTLVARALQLRRPARLSTTSRASPTSLSAPHVTNRTYPHTVVATITDNVGPIDRGAMYEDPLDAVLQPAGLGAVCGGGSQLDASRKIAFVDIEVALADTERALEQIGRAHV